MKLLEVIQPLLENKVDHIANNQTKKIWDRLIDDTSIMLRASVGVYRRGDSSPSDFIFYERIYDHIQQIHQRILDTNAKEQVGLQMERLTLYPLGIDIPYITEDFYLEDYSNIEDAMTDLVSLVVRWMSDNISKKYLQWVVNQYITASSDENPANDFALAEDYQMVADSLKIYHQMKSEIGVPLTNKVSTADLFELVEPYRQAMDAEAAKAKEKELLARGEIEIPFSQGPKELVIIPKTFEASHYLSEPNGWCTQYENWFAKYTKDDQTLYYFRHEGKPHLVHFESNQFMKKGNRPFDVKSVRESSPAFQWIIEQKKKEVENAKTGDPSWAAYVMVKGGLTKDTEWAMRVIENAKTGHPSRVAYFMVRNGHTKDTEWAMSVIENATTGNPSEYAYLMVRDGYTNDIEWAMRVIENAKTGNPTHAAYRMVEGGHAPREWYDRNFG